jgi:Wadjet anti plasmid transformation system JetA-like protein
MLLRYYLRCVLTGYIIVASVIGSTPGLFERIPRGLFGPLGDPYAELYWELLSTLYTCEFEREPFIVLRPVAIEIAENAIRSSNLWTERRADLEELAREEVSLEFHEDRERRLETDGPDENTVVRALARRLTTRLERSGWIHFQYRSGQGEIMSFHPYAARILETLLRVARDEEPIFQGLVHSIAALLDPKAFAQRPGVSLAEAKRHTLELARELKILERNIHLFTQRLLDQANTAATILAEGIDRYEHAILANYHRLKTIDNVYRQRSAILDRLAAIERDEQALESAAEWYAMQHRLEIAQARASVRTDLHLLRSHFDAIPDLVSEIDARNARFSGVALRKLRYLLRQDRRTETQLEFIVGTLARGEAPELEFEVYRCELLSDAFLYTPPTRRPKTAPQVLAVTVGIDREKVYKDAASRVQRLFARRRIEEFVREFLGARSSASLDELPINGDQDYVRLLYLIGYGMDGSASFHFDPDTRRLNKGPYGYPSGRLARSRNRATSRDSNPWTLSRTTQN